MAGDAGVVIQSPTLEEAMAELEKLTINLTPVDLGQIELLVEQGFYSNRAEFIRVAIRDQIAKHADALRDTAARETLMVGAMLIDRSALERHRKDGHRMHLRVVGYLGIKDDVTPELAAEVIEKVRVRGIFRASGAVKAALADRTEA
jgi:Arc/MetJ-type ribon-helix-helix transcriptional regulator